jgi:hypothetical protein
MPVAILQQNLVTSLSSRPFLIFHTSESNKFMMIAVQILSMQVHRGNLSDFFVALQKPVIYYASIHCSYHAGPCMP